MDTIDIVNAIIQYGEIAVSLGMLGFLYFKYHKNTLEEQWLKKSLRFIILFFAAMTAAKICGKYYFLATNPLGKLFLPPTQSWAWFAQTALQKYLAPYLIALAFGAFMYKAAQRTNAYFDGELFLAHDKYILFMAALMTGWPNFMLYLLAVVALALAQSVYSSLRHKTAAVRIILTHALIIAVPLVIFGSVFAARYVPLWKLTI